MSNDTPPANEKWFQNRWVQMIVGIIITNTFSILTTWLLHASPPVVPVVPPDDNKPVIVQTGGRGWINDPDAVAAAIPQIAASQGMPAEFGQVANALIGAEDANRSVFFWQAEEKVLGKVQPSWDQGPVGTCVSFGWARGCQDLMLLRVASGENNEKWPGHTVATEPIYGGSRVEIGGGRIRGDGSVGAWAAQYVQKYGLLFRQKYSTQPGGAAKYDLTTYSPSLSRSWGKTGVPNDLEPIAKEHPVTAVARLANGTELWAALGSAYPVPVCSDYGFEGNPPPDGIMEPRGQWGHCMLFRGRFMHATKGKCVVVQNSWDGYIPRITVETTDAGHVELPEGCFAIRLTVADKMVREGDTFAISGVQGFPKRKPRDWFTYTAPSRRRELFSDATVFALGL